MLLSTAIRQAKRSYFASLCHPGADGRDDFWRAYRKLSTSTTRVPATLHRGSETATTAASKACMLNDFFVLCFSPGSVSPYKDFASPLSVSAEAGLSSFQCDASDVMAAISTMKTRTSSGPDDISSPMLRGCAGSLSGRLACIFNASFSSGIVPSDWKVSRVTPIYKRGGRRSGLQLPPYISFVPGRKAPGEDSAQCASRTISSLNRPSLVCSLALGHAAPPRRRWSI